MKTILVTGGCGFIGSHFVRLLLRCTDKRVVNLDKLTYAGDARRLAGIEEGERYRFVQGDIADRRLVDGLVAGEDLWAIVNFAAESHVDRSILDPFPFLQTNVMGAQSLLEVSRKHRISRFLQVSTDEVYGDAEGKAPFSEQSPLQPSSPYAASKAAADLLCLAYRRTYDVPIVILRSANNYGPFQFPEKLIPLMICNALAGEALPVYGDGSQTRDWLYVDDNCEAILGVLERGQLGAIYNAAAGEYRPNLEVVRATCRVLAEGTGKSLDSILMRIRFVPDRPGHDRRYVLDTQKIRAELGWIPRMSFESGLRKTVRWYLEHRDWVEQVRSADYKAYYEAVYQRTWDRAPQ